MIFFAATAAHQNDMAAIEAEQCRASDISVVPGGVEFSGELEAAYRFCLWSRTASRLLMRIAHCPDVQDADALYHAAKEIPWEQHASLTQTFSITSTVIACSWLKNSQFGAVRVKDAICDRMRELYGDRPSVDASNPDITYHLHIHSNDVLLYIDLSGRSLHRRGYRQREAGSAVLKEHLAASVLIRANWLEMAAKGLPLIDPLCGAGTLPIEAALMASDTAPGLFTTEEFGFLAWQGHDKELWDTLLGEAYDRHEAGIEKLPPIFGWDVSEESLAIARSHAKRAGLEGKITFELKDFRSITEADLPEGLPAGLVVMDPPYGVRMGKSEELSNLYRAIGKTLYDFFPGWQASILAGNSELLGFVDLKPTRTNVLFNGPIQCQLAHYVIFDLDMRKMLAEKAEARRLAKLQAPVSEGEEMFINRLKKNQRQLKAYLKREGITSYRLYDADLPEYSAAVDVYEGRWVSLQEYAPPKTIPEETAYRRLQEMIDGVSRVLDIERHAIYIKQRKRQKGDLQYTKKDDTNQFYIMRENGLKFLVNFTDYLDTGIFLDHRATRKKIKELSNNCRFLNLFAYTGTATVHAAAGGALSTVTVDASSTYLAWAERNMKLNEFSGMNHFYYRADCFTWLRDNRDTFDLIFLDPPTFSNSSDRRGTFDIQRDHFKLVHEAVRHLTPNGTLIFSTNYKQFKLDPGVERDFLVEEITKETLPQDFLQKGRIHKCWLIRPKRTVKSIHKVEPKATVSQQKPTTSGKRIRLKKETVQKNKKTDAEDKDLKITW